MVYNVLNFCYLFYVERTQNCPLFSVVSLVVFLCTRGRSPTQQADIEGSGRSLAPLEHAAMHLKAGKAKLAASKRKVRGEAATARGADKIPGERWRLASGIAERLASIPSSLGRHHHQPHQSSGIINSISNRTAPPPVAPCVLTVLASIASTGELRRRRATEARKVKADHAI